MSITTASVLVALSKLMGDALADLDQSLDEGDFEMAGDHALTIEELARQFQEKAS